MRRIFLFILVNIGVVLTISIVMAVLGVEPYLNANGLDYQALIVFALIWGFGGSFISLQISRWMAKKAMGVELVEANHPLYQQVEKLARRAELPMPEVGIYQSPEMNAFATGPSKKRALVAVSSGLLDQADDSALEGIIGHELAHIKNGDMVTMALLQGVINAFVIFFARVAAFAVQRALGDRDGAVGGFAYFITVIVFEILFSILGSVVVMWFSRQREYRADAGGARIASTASMIHGLEFIQKQQPIPVPAEQKNMRAMMIRNQRPEGLRAYFASHPPLEERIARLKAQG